MDSKFKMRCIAISSSSGKRCKNTFYLSDDDEWNIKDIFCNVHREKILCDIDPEICGYITEFIPNNEEDSKSDSEIDDIEEFEDFEEPYDPPSIASLFKTIGFSLSILASIASYLYLLQ